MAMTPQQAASAMAALSGAPIVGIIDTRNDHE